MVFSLAFVLLLLLQSEWRCDLSFQLRVQTFQELKPMMRRVISFIFSNLSDDINLDDLAKAGGVSKFSLSRQFQKDYGMSPMRWLWMFRAMVAAEIIKIAPNWPLTDVAFHCGFGSSAHFSRTFVAIHGVAPSVFRRRCHGLNTVHTSRRFSNQFDQMVEASDKILLSVLETIGS